jgi:hypothetical protein
MAIKRREACMPDVHHSADCWVDIFDDDYFMERMRRLKGPQKLRQSGIKSLIVGPGAIAVLKVLRNNRESVVRLEPRRLVPDLAESIGKGAKFREVVVESIE